MSMLFFVNVEQVIDRDELNEFRNVNIEISAELVQASGKFNGNFEQKLPSTVSRLEYVLIFEVLWIYSCDWRINFFLQKREHFLLIKILVVHSTKEMVHKVVECFLCQILWDFLVFMFHRAYHNSQYFSPRLSVIENHFLIKAFNVAKDGFEFFMS